MSSQILAPNAYAAQQQSMFVSQVAEDSSAGQKVACAASLFAVFTVILYYNWRSLLKIKNIKLKWACIAAVVIFILCQVSLFSTAMAEKIHKKPIKSSIGWWSIIPYLILCCCAILGSAAAGGMR